MDSEGIGAQGLKTKLIINYLPQNMSDQQFNLLFSQIGPVASAKVMREKGTNYSFGYGFVDYINPSHAIEAIDKLNGHRIEHKTLKVAFSKPSNSEKNANLYVNGLGSHINEDNLLMLFSNHGEVINTKLLRENDGSSKGAGFVLFKTKEEAEAAIKALQGYVDGCGSHFQIKYAKDASEQQRSHPKYKQFVQKKFNHTQHPNPIGYQHQTLYGSGNDAYGYQMISVGSQGAYIDAGNVAYPGSYATVPHGSLGGQKASRGRGGGTRYNPIARPINGSSNIVVSPITTSNEESSTVLFVYNIGPDAKEGDIYPLFATYGRIAKIDVVEGKGYAFVHMPIFYEASEAVQRLNGFMYNGKALQVSIKTKK